MSYSNINPAWHRMMQGRADAQAEAEKALAGALMRSDPTLTWGQALGLGQMLDFVASHGVEWYVDGAAVMVLDHGRYSDGSYMTTIWRATDMAGCMMALNY